MNIIIIGGPASGKGTLSKKLGEKLNIPCISTGELLRNENSTFATNSKMLSGEMVDDSLMCDILFQRISKEDCQNGFILDGFPRTINQAKILEVTKKIDKVILLETDFNVALKRVLDRRICQNCHSSLSISSLKNDLCPFCNSSVTIREDDNETTFANRVKLYKESINEIVNFYEEKGILVKVSNNDTEARTFEMVNDILSK